MNFSPKYPLIPAGTTLRFRWLPIFGIILFVCVFVGCFKQTADNSNPTNTVSEATAQKSPSEKPANSPTPGEISPEQADSVKKEIADFITAWNKSVKERNLEKHLNFYAEEVEYYRNRNATAADIRADRQRSFQLYDTIDINISDLFITLDNYGERATTTFDKEWNFTGKGRSDAGKVKQQLQLAKTDGRWLITGERDLQVYIDPKIRRFDKQKH